MADVQVYATQVGFPPLTASVWSWTAWCDKCALNLTWDLPSPRTWVDVFAAAENHARTYAHKVSRKNWGKQ
jgi:hypothetical protein